MEPHEFLARLLPCPQGHDRDGSNEWFERNDPDVIIGWSVIQFDLRVLQKARRRLRGDAASRGESGGLSNGGSIRESRAICSRRCPAGWPSTASRHSESALWTFRFLQPGSRIAGAAGRRQGDRRRIRQDGRDRAAVPGGQACARRLQHSRLRAGPAHLREGQAASNS